MSIDHLHSSTITLLALTKPERVKFCKQKRWISYEAARLAYERIEELFTDERQQRPENLLLLASTGNGKSMILERFRDKHLSDDNPEGEAVKVPVLHIEIPEEPTLDIIRVTILKRLFAPSNTRNNRADRRAEVFELLSRVETKMVLVDELHNLLFASAHEREKILAFFRAIGNQLRTNIVAAGTQDARRTLQSDRQLLNRFDIHRLPLWKNDQTLRRLLASFESLFPLRNPSNLAANDELARFVIYKTDGLIAEISKLLRRGAIAAIQSGEERITLQSLRTLNFLSPTERKEVVEDLEPWGA
jgi:hypothetical protein